MPHRDTLIIDVASTPIDGVEAFISDGEPPENYTKPDSIAKWQAGYRARQVEKAALDFDLARISMIGIGWPDGTVSIDAIRNEDTERLALFGLATTLNANVSPTLITFNGNYFDLPLLMRRAKYLGVSFPAINIDRYRSPHLDLLAILSGGDKERRKSLLFYCKRLGWTDICKTLTGAEEAQAPAKGQWAELEQSVRHDLEATRRLAQWLGLLEPVSEPVL